MTHTSSNFSSFGALLKTFRKRQHLTQYQLAEVIGVHRSTLIHWEQGNFLPAGKTMVLELVRHLKLDEQETRQLLEASLTALAPHWSVPYPRNPYFTGREEILEALHTQLGIEQAVALTQSSALHGLGGVGKTQIALEYTYRHALEYSAVFWIGAETEGSIIASLLHIAETLQVPEREDKDQQRVIAAVQRWLSSHGQWLLIWDNVEDLDLLRRFLSPTRAGAILLTTRYQALGTLARGLDLLPMEQEEGMLFLLRRAKMLEPEATSEHLCQFAGRVPAQYQAAMELMEALGGLPLALDQAGAYLEETQCGLPAYLELSRTRRSALLQQRGEGARDHPASVSMTFTLAIAAIAQHHPAVLDLLHICALLQPDAIPEELFRQASACLGPTLEDACSDPLEWDRVVGVACSHSLLSRQPEEQTLSLHRLVQVVLREEMSEQERTIWQRRTIHGLSALFPEVTSEGTAPIWKQCERLLPHVLAAVATITDQEEDQELVRVVGKAADYLCERVQYERAEPLYERALKLGEQILGPMHPEMAYPLTGLANLYQEQGRFEQAKPLYLRALRIREQAFGSEHPLVAHPLNGLAILYQKQGSSAQAEPLFQRALSIWEQALGPMHPLVTRPLNGLAILYKRQGKPEQAELLYERALSIQTQALGPEHPQLSRLLYNLALLYEEQGKYEQAEPLFQQSLKLGEQVWGPEHPNLAHPLNGLAILYQEQGKDAQAESLFQRALHLWEQALGAEHLLVAYPLYNLAILSQRQGKYEQAEQLLQQSLHIAEQALGPEHPQAVYPLNGLAELYAEQGKEDQAESLYTRALQIREQTLGREHPDLAFSLNGLANLYALQGKQKQAEPLYERALFIREQHLGSQHPETAQTLHDLAIFRQKQGNLDEAVSLAERALKIRVQSLGDAHPKTVATHTLYDQLLQAQTDVQEEAASEQHVEAIPDPHSEEHQVNQAPLTPTEYDPLQGFLDVCCEQHLRAWCRSADLWRAYEQWTKKHQERFPLSRAAFTQQLKVHGCRADRTKSTRIWRGVALVKTGDDGR